MWTHILLEFNILTRKILSRSSNFHKVKNFENKTMSDLYLVSIYNRVNVKFT